MSWLISKQKQQKFRQRNKEVAQIAAEQKKIQAEGDAEATRIKAQAEADANREVAASLTPELIEKLKYEQWDGELPQVQGGSTPIVNLGE